MNARHAAVSLVVLATFCFGCSREPRSITAPTPVNLSGQWSGTFFIESCPNYPTNCGFFTRGTPPTDSFPLELTLMQDGQQLTGTLQPTLWSWVPTPVSGAVVNGVVHLSGRSEFTLEACNWSGYFVLHDLEAVLDVRSGRFTGRLSFNGFKPLSSCYAAQIEVIGRDLQIARVQ